MSSVPCFFPQGHLATEWWTVVNKDEVCSISDASLVADMFTKLVGETEKGVEKILSRKVMLTEVQKAETVIPHRTTARVVNPPDNRTFVHVR